MKAFIQALISFDLQVVSVELSTPAKLRPARVQCYRGKGNAIINIRHSFWRVEKKKTWNQRHWLGSRPGNLSLLGLGWGSLWVQVDTAEAKRGISTGIEQINKCILWTPENSWSSGTRTTCMSDRNAQKGDLVFTFKLKLCLFFCPRVSVNPTMTLAGFWGTRGHSQGHLRLCPLPPSAFNWSCKMCLLYNENNSGY